MGWDYNSTSGLIASVPDPIQRLLLSSGSGWHGPFATHQAALDFYNSNKAANPGWTPPTDSLGSAVGNLPGADLNNAVNAIPSPFQSIISNFQQWALRISEIILGVVLIGVAVAKMSGADNAVSKIVKSAAGAAKVAAVAA